MSEIVTKQEAGVLAEVIYNISKRMGDDKVLRGECKMPDGQRWVFAIERVDECSHLHWKNTRDGKKQCIDCNTIFE